MSLELVREIEVLAANAWPAAVVEEVDGWRLRFTSGVTRRANSVWPNAAGGRFSLPEKLARVEAFYAGRGCPARYQICPAAQPAHLDAILAERGYTQDAVTCVQTAALSTLIGRTGSRSGFHVSVAGSLEEPWYGTFCQAEGVSGPAAEIRRSILQRIAHRTGYALLRLEGQPIALGLGVLECDWVGLFVMATCPEFRRQGAATAVLHTLATWAQHHGAVRAYLQVMEDNHAARSVYHRTGFETLYAYHYREARG